MVRQGKPNNAYTLLQDSTSKLDVDVVGIASLDEWKGTKLEECAVSLLPEARSVIVFAGEIYPETLNLARPGRTMGQASPNDLLDNNVNYINGELNKATYQVAKACRNNGVKALPLPAAPFDARFLEAVFSFKHAAQAAGLGYLGRSSLLITPDFGPRLRLSCCLVGAPLEPTKTKVGVINLCKSCKICINNCPAGAIQTPQSEEPYVINKFACSTFLNESGGCSECMRLCPAGR